MVTKLTLEYDGAGFAGWVRQPGLRTVQEELERALQTVLGASAGDGTPLKLTVAGRTDRGVHAWGQVASYAHEAVDPQRLNSLLEHDLAVLAAEPAPEGFDARRDARSRTYCYRVLTRRARSALERGRALWWPGELDRDALAQCAAALLGRHDFTAFTPTETEHTRFERTVLRAQWRSRPLREPGGSRVLGAGRAPGGGRTLGAGGAGGAETAEVLETAAVLETAEAPETAEVLETAEARETAEVLECWLEADTFMRHMSRTLVGTMLDVAAGALTVEQFKALLEGAPRAHAGKTAPAHGLALAGVSYA